MAERSAAQRIKQLDEERAALFDEAKAEALKRAKEAVAELNSLALNYALVDGAKAVGKTGKAPPKAGAFGKGIVKDAPCPICEFKTSPPHDARAHRGQAKKKPFTATELSSKGMTKA